MLSESRSGVPDDGLDDAVRLIGRHWKRMLAGGVITCAIAVVATIMVPPSYKAEVLLATIQQPHALIAVTNATVQKIAESADVISQVRASALKEGLITDRFSDEDLQVKLVKGDVGKGDGSLIALCVSLDDPQKSARLANVWGEAVTVRVGDLVKSVSIPRIHQAEQAFSDSMKEFLDSSKRRIEVIRQIQGKNDGNQIVETLPTELNGVVPSKGDTRISYGSDSGVTRLDIREFVGFFDPQLLANRDYLDVLQRESNDAQLIKSSLNSNAVVVAVPAVAPSRALPRYVALKALAGFIGGLLLGLGFGVLRSGRVNGERLTILVSASA